MYGETGHTHHRVQAISLDDFCDKFALRPDFLKMDIEGAEYDALLGAKKTISQCRPKLLIELHHFDGNAATNPVPKLLMEWSYRIQWIERWEWTSHILARPATN